MNKCTILPKPAQLFDNLAQWHIIVYDIKENLQAHKHGS